MLYSSITNLDQRLKKLEPQEHELVPADVRYDIINSQFTNIGTMSGHNGSLSNISYDTDNSAIFNGSSSLVRTGIFESVDMGIPFSLEAIVHFKLPNSNTVAFRTLAGTDSASAPNTNFGQYDENLSPPTNVSFNMWGGVSSPGQTIPFTSLSNGFHHLVMTKTSSTISTYLDGVLFGSTVSTVGLRNSELVIGYANSSTRRFYGNLKAFSIYKKALDLSEVTQNYEYYLENGYI